MKIVADDKIPYLKGILEPYCHIEYIPSKEITNYTIKDADAIIIRTRTKVNRELLENTKVKFVATATIGFDHIDTNYCEQNHIFWTNAPGCNTGSVMQYVATALTHLQQQLKFKYPKRTLGVIGVGNVGRKIVKLGEILGMRVLLNDPPLVRKYGFCGYIELDTLLKESDIITIHTPLNVEGEDKTFHLFNNTTFSKLNKSIFINTARGEVANTESIKTYILKGIIEKAVIDVWENEPNIDTDLLKLSSIATPHIAGYSADGKANATIQCIKAIDQFFHLGINKNLSILLPDPKEPEIVIDCKLLSFEDIIYQAINHSYPILNDHKQLTHDPKNFEKLRENYPIRREFHAYTIKLLHAQNEIITALKKFGFNLKEY